MARIYDGVRALSIVFLRSFAMAMTAFGLQG
jgi:hypothetical protein